MSESKEFAVSLLSCLSLCCCLVHSGGQAGSLERLLRVTLILIHALVTCLRKLAFFQACVDDVGQSLNITRWHHTYKETRVQAKLTTQTHLVNALFFSVCGSVGQLSDLSPWLTPIMAYLPLLVSLLREGGGEECVCVCALIYVLFILIVMCLACAPGDPQNLKLEVAGSVCVHNVTRNQKTVMIEQCRLVHDEQ